MAGVTGATTEGAYAALKRANLDANVAEASEGRLHVASLPLSLCMELTLACDLTCRTCMRQAPEHVGRVWPTLPWELFDQVSREVFPGALRAVLSHDGEPLLHPRFDEVIERCLSYEVRPVLNTNGTSLTRDRARLLARAGAAVGLSIDAATGATFERLRAPARWEGMLEALERVRAAGRDEGNPLFAPSLAVVVQRDNLHELEDVVRLAVRSGVRSVAFSRLELHHDALRPLTVPLEDAAAVLVKAVSLATSLGVRASCPEYLGTRAGERLVAARRANLAVPLPWDGDPASQDVAYPSPWERCRVPWSEAFVSADGALRVGRCSEQELGRLQGRSFAEVWNGFSYWKLRSSVNRAPQPCCMPGECRYRGAAGA